MGVGEPFAPPMRAAPKRKIKKEIENKTRALKSKYLNLLKSASYDMNYGPAAINLVLQSGMQLYSQEGGVLSAKIPEKIEKIDKKLKSLRVVKGNNEDLNNKSKLNIQKGISLFSDAVEQDEDSLYRKVGKNSISPGRPTPISDIKPRQNAYAKWVFDNLLEDSYEGDMSNVILRFLNVRQRTLDNYRDKSVIDFYKDVWNGKKGETSSFGGVKNNRKLVKFRTQLNIIEDEEVRNKIFLLCLAFSLVLPLGPFGLVVGFLVGYFLDTAIETVFGGSGDFKITMVDPGLLLFELEEFVSSLENKHKYDNPESSVIDPKDLDKIKTILNNIDTTLVQNIINVSQEENNNDFEDFFSDDLADDAPLFGKEPTVGEVISFLKKRIENYKERYDKFLEIESQIVTSIKRAASFELSGLRSRQNQTKTRTPRPERLPLDRGFRGEPTGGIRLYENKQNFNRKMKRLFGSRWYAALQDSKGKIGNYAYSAYKEGPWRGIKSILKTQVYKKVWEESFESFMNFISKGKWEELKKFLFQTKREDRYYKMLHKEIEERKNQISPLSEKDWIGCVTFRISKREVIVLGLLSTGAQICFKASTSSGNQYKEFLSLSKNIINIKKPNKRVSWRSNENKSELFSELAIDRCKKEYTKYSKDINNSIIEFENSSDSEIKSSVEALRNVKNFSESLIKQLEAFKSKPSAKVLKNIGDLAAALEIIRFSR